MKGLKPQCFVGTIGYGRVMVDGEIDIKMHDLYRIMLGDCFKDNCILLDNKYQDIWFPFDRIECPECESEHDWTIEDLQGCFYSWSAVQRYIDEKHYDPTKAILDSFRTLWRGETAS